MASAAQIAKTATTTGFTSDNPGGLTDAGVFRYAAEAPAPTLTFNGTKAAIDGVRFCWTAHCSWCRKSTTLWADGGRVELGLKQGSKTAPSTWFQRDMPPAAPSLPRRCPRQGCPMPTLVEGKYGPSYQPGWTTQPRREQGLSVGQAVLRMADEAWSAMRRDFPTEARAADRRAGIR